MTPDALTYTVPLSISAHTIAQDRTAHLGAHRRDQYLNILAVLSAQYFLNSLGIQAEIEDLESPLVAVMPLSDITLPGVGLLHCQPILPEDTHLSIPIEAQSDRVGYLAIQFREDLREAIILGYATESHPPAPLTELGDVEEFLHYVSHLESQAASASNLQPSPQSSEPIINLREWLTGSISQGWSDLNDLLNPHQLAFRGDRVTVPRDNTIQLELHLGNSNFILEISVIEAVDQPLVVESRLYPVAQDLLPAQLRLQIQNPQTQAVISETVVGEGDPSAQVRLEGQSGDRLRAVIVYESEQFAQDFLV